MADLAIVAGKIMRQTAQGVPLNRSISLGQSAARRTRYPASGGTLVASVAVIDFIVVAAALSVTWWLRFETGISEIGVPAPHGTRLADYFGHIFIGAALMVLTLFNFRAYAYDKLLSSAHELRVVFRSALVWFILFTGMTLILKIQPSISRIYCTLGAVAIVVSLSYWRLVLTHYIIPAVGRSLRRSTLLIGWNEDTQQIADMIGRSNSPEFEFKGVLLPGGDDARPSELPPAIPILGEPGSLEKILRNEPFDSVLVADFDLNRDQLSQIAWLCEKEMVNFELIPNCFPSLISGLSVKRAYGVPVLGVSRLPLQSTLNVCIKRLIDIAGALVGLVLSLPIMLLFAHLIRKESPGKVIYRQRRVGLKGREFDVLKLRSMGVDAEPGGEAGWTVTDDPRCLKVGKFMRKWNIDEVPQFWNVLKGEMSLVGPRPERPELINRFKEEIPHYNARHSVKPGITGWAQVNGLRGDTDLSDRIEHDLHYIENWNVSLDSLILMRTFLSHKGAC
jgi:exopolysaccharide biosynthesis polyprenyl glycosylphosphotransferase